MNHFLLMLRLATLNTKYLSELIFVIEFVLLGVLVIHQLVQYQSAYSATLGSNSSNIQPLKLSGPITSVQFSKDGNAQSIVSGRWRMEVDFDKTGLIPEAKRFNTTLVVASIDGSDTQRYELSNIKQDQASYDNKTNTLLIKGKLTLSSKSPMDNIGVLLKLINKKILTISLDPSQVRDELGDTPIYGVER